MGLAPLVTLFTVPAVDAVGEALAGFAVQHSDGAAVAAVGVAGGATMPPGVNSYVGADEFCCELVLNRIVVLGDDLLSEVGVGLVAPEYLLAVSFAAVLSYGLVGAAY